MPSSDIMVRSHYTCVLNISEELSIKAKLEINVTQVTITVSVPDKDS